MEINAKSPCNKIPKIEQDFSGNLEAKYWLKAQLGIKNNERATTVYKVSSIEKNDSALKQVMVNALGEVLSDITERSRVEELQAIDLSCQKLQHLTNVPCSDKFLLTKKAPFNLGDSLCSIGSLFLGENMLPKDHCDLLLCLFTFDHVAVHPFTLTTTINKISRALKPGGILVTMYFDSKKIVQTMDRYCVDTLGFDDKSCLVDYVVHSPSSSEDHDHLLKPVESQGSFLGEDAISSDKPLTTSKQPKDFEIDRDNTHVNSENNKFELKVEEDVELHSCFKYLLKGRLMCGKAYPVLKKEVRHTLTMKNGLALRDSFNLAKYLKSESSSYDGNFHDVCRCIVTEVYQR